VTDTPEELDLYAQADEARAEVRRLSKTLAKDREQRIRLEETISLAARAAFSAMEPPVIPKPPKDDRRKGAETCVAIATDWHLGALTADYNLDIAEQRVNLYRDKIIGLADIQRADHPVKHLRVWALGDLVHGERIFPGQEWEIDASLIEQTVGRGMSIFRDFLLGLAPHFDSIEIQAVPGNHGRLASPKSPFHPDTNADRLLYMVTQEATVKEPRIRWTIARAGRGETGRILIDRIGSYNTLLTHGDLFRGGNSFAGLPFYSMTKVLKWAQMAQSGEMEAFTDVACGHWHRCGVIPIGTGVIRIGGTLLTYDPWSRETLAASSQPQQMLLFVHPEHGVTAEYRVRLS